MGRGYRPAELNKNAKQPIGIIAVDSLFSPVSKIKYAIEAARVGMKTDYDRLVLEVWTDGRIDPVAAMVQSSELLLQHIELFKNAGVREDLRIRRDVMYFGTGRDKFPDIGRVISEMGDNIRF